MIKECTEILAKNLEKNPDFISNNYSLYDVGDYIIIKKDGTIQSIKFNKNIDLNKDDLLYRKICFYEYHSRLISMNKPQDPKKLIHSNNYMSFWVKYDSFDNGKLNIEAIDRYFDVLINPRDKYKNADRKMYDFIYQQIGDVDVQQLERNRKWIKENIFQLDKLGLNLQKKNYLKIFFEEDDNTYIKEDKRYLIPNIFTTNNNIELDSDIYGVPNNNIVLNPKKPYMEHKTKKVTVPYMINIEQALLQRELFTYLLINTTKGKNAIYFDMVNNEIVSCQSGELPQYDFNGLVLFVQKGLNAVIKYANTVHYTYKLKEPFIVKQFLHLQDDNEKYYNKYTNRQELIDIIDNILFSKYLKNNLFNEIEDLSINANIKRNLILYRDCIIDWIFNEYKGNIDKTLHKISTNLTIQLITDGYLSRAVLVFNTLLSLYIYFGKNVSNNKYNNIQSNLTTDEEYWFSVGRLIQTYSCICLGHDRNAINNLLTISNTTTLMAKLDKIFIKYNYKIKSDKILQLYSKIKEYNCHSKTVDEIEVIAGYLYSYCLIKEK